MKIWSSEHVFNHPWETVVLAAWRKYPNPINPSVTGVDTVERSVDSSGRLCTHRVLSTEWGFPDWLTRFIGMNNACYVSEHSEVNPAERVMKLRSRNLNFCNFVTIDEQLVYAPHPSDASSTVLRSESVINVHGLPMTSYMENCIKGTMASKAGQGRLAMEWVIQRLKEETQELGRAARGELDAGLKNLASGFTTATSSL